MRGVSGGANRSAHVAPAASVLTLHTQLHPSAAATRCSTRCSTCWPAPSEIALGTQSGPAVQDGQTSILCAARRPVGDNKTARAWPGCSALLLRLRVPRPQQPVPTEARHPAGPPALPTRRGLCHVKLASTVPLPAPGGVAQIKSLPILPAYRSPLRRGKGPRRLDPHVSQTHRHAAALCGRREGRNPSAHRYAPLGARAAASSTPTALSAGPGSNFSRRSSRESSAVGRTILAMQGPGRPTLLPKVCAS